MNDQAVLARTVHGFTSPLRYPGGKGALANFVKLLLQKNRLLDGHYAEVYAGGAGIAWPLLFGEYVQRVHINDLNRSVYAFWETVLTATEDLCRLVRDVPVTIEEWYRQREIQANPQHYSLLELGFSTFFLNRTNRSGIIRGGVIGGKGQQSKWKLDVRFNKGDLVGRIERIARYANRIDLYNRDAGEFITEVLPSLPAKALVYLDPPYFTKGPDLYEDHYVPEDHARIAGLATRIAQPWIVSYDAAPEIKELYGGFRRLEYQIGYSAQSKYFGSEVMFFGPSLVVPRVQNPARVGQQVPRQ